MKLYHYFEENIGPFHSISDLRKAKDLGIDKMLVTCDEGNVASEKVILANGGVYEKTIEVEGSRIKRYWITCADIHGSRGTVLFDPRYIGSCRTVPFDPQSEVKCDE